MSGAASQLLLSLRNVSRRFGATVALDGAAIDVRAGTLHALLGENGAGKTTLMRIAFGMLSADSGSVVVDGVPRNFRSSADALALGIGMVHQHFLLVGAMTAAENVALGEGGAFRQYDPSAAAERVRSISRESGFAIDPSVLARDLPVGAQQRLEIMKALARKARLLILDEPTAVLAPAEALELYRWLRAFVSAGGTAVLITHKLREALQRCDDVTILRRGRTVLASAAGSLSEEAAVRALVGEGAPALQALQRADGAAPGEVILRLDGAGVVDSSGVARLRGATLDVRAGEIVGVVGVESSGQRELLRVLAGRLRPGTGAVTLPPVVGFVPEDRLQDALVPEFTIAENVALLGAGAARGRMPWDSVASRARRIIAEFDVRVPGVDARMDALSGGNQQKFVLGRELGAGATALVVENPTRGLDILATAYVLAAIRRAAHEGRAAVVFHSSDVEEVLAIANRVFVCFGGRVHEVPGGDHDVVARAMVGAA